MELKACSRCHTELYCSRECQREAWPQHKDVCHTIADGLATLSKKGLQWVRLCTAEEAKNVLEVIPQCTNVAFRTFHCFRTVDGSEAIVQFHRCEPPCTDSSIAVREHRGPPDNACPQCGSISYVTKEDAEKDAKRHSITCQTILAWIKDVEQRGSIHIGACSARFPFLSCGPASFVATHEFERPNGNRYALRLHGHPENVLCGVRVHENI